jgi:hypothetical protein
LYSSLSIHCQDELRCGIRRDNFQLWWERLAAFLVGCDEEANALLNVSDRLLEVLIVYEAARERRDFQAPQVIFLLGEEDLYCIDTHVSPLNLLLPAAN